DPEVIDGEIRGPIPIEDKMREIDQELEHWSRKWRETPRPLGIAVEEMRMPLGEPILPAGTGQKQQSIDQGGDIVVIRLVGPPERRVHQPQQAEDDQQEEEGGPRRVAGFRGRRDASVQHQALINYIGPPRCRSEKNPRSWCIEPSETTIRCAMLDNETGRMLQTDMRDYVPNCPLARCCRFRVSRGVVTR